MRSVVLRRLLAVLIVVVMTLVAGCDVVTQDPSVLAVVGPREIGLADFDAFLERTVGDGALELESVVLSALLDQFIEEQQVVLLAEERELVEAGATAEQALVALLADAISDSVGDREIATYYREHEEEFQLPERVELYQVLVEEREVAEEALTQLAAGVPFADVARNLSVGPSRAFGGYQGEIARDDLPTALADTIFALEEGEASEIIEADFRYHVFYVGRRRPEETAPLEEVAAEIEGLLQAERADRARTRVRSEARARYAVEIYDARLPFAYEGQLDTPE